MYFLEEGSAELVLENFRSKDDPISVCKIKENETIGMRSFFSGLQNSESALTTGFCSIWFIKLSEFERVLQNHPKDKVN